MRTIRFPLLDRLVLTPMEINPAMKKFPWIAAAVFLAFGLEPRGLLFREAWFNGLPFLILALASVFAGALVTPALLPVLPFRSFAVKGWIAGLFSVFLLTRFVGPAGIENPFLTALAYVIFPALSSYVALQFTGSTTFTGMSGVRKELKIGIPLYFGAAATSAVLLVLFKIREWGIL